MLRLRLFAFSILIVLLASCSSDSPIDPPSPSPVLIDVSGTVVDESGNAIAGAQVDMSQMITSTNANGIFIIKNVPVSAERNYLKVDKVGYFFSGRNVYVDESSTVVVKVILVERTMTGSFNAGAGGTVSTSDGMRVQIPANAIAGGYQGEVRVYSKFLDPSLTNTAMTIPGMEGINAEGEEGILRSFGMGHIELEDENGGELELAEGVMAQIGMPVPADYLSVAEPTIPLWYFDEQQGVWIEEGEATLQGDEYVGEVSHFTMWNCDDWGCSLVMTVHVNCAGVSTTGIRLLVEVGSPPFQTGVGYVNELGWLRMRIPCGTEISLVALAPKDSGLDVEHPIGGFVTPEMPGQGGDVSFDSICGPYSTVSGQVVDASLDPVSNGYIYLTYSDYQTDILFLDDDGRFTTTFYDYSPSQDSAAAQIIAWNMDDLSMAEGPLVPFNNQLNELSAPIIIGGAPVSVEGRVYVTDNSSDDFYYCLDAADGSLIWEKDLGNSLVDASAAYFDGRIFIPRSSTIHCLNVFDGAEIWSGGLPEGFSPFVEDEVLYTSQPSGFVRARNALTGDHIWGVDLEAGLGTAPTISGNLLFCSSGSLAPGMQALDKTDGSTVWGILTPDFVDSSPAVSDGRLFYGCNDQKLYARDAATGDLIWEASIDDNPSQYGSPTVGNGMVYFQSFNHLWAFDVATGAVEWTVDVQSKTIGGNPYLYQNMLIAQSSRGPVYCFDALDGTVLYELGSSGISGGMGDYTVAGGVLFIHRNAEPQTLEARNVENGQLIWTSPVQARMRGPIVVVDSEGNAHYPTRSGMQQ